MFELTFTEVRVDSDSQFFQILKLLWFTSKGDLVLDIVLQTKVELVSVQGHSISYIDGLLRIVWSTLPQRTVV